MNKVSVWLSAGIMLVAGTVWGVQRGAVQNVVPTFLETGNAVRGLSVSVGSTTPILVYSPRAGVLGNYPTADRQLTLQNRTNVALFCSTFNFVNQAGMLTAPRWMVVSSESFKTTALTNIWCLYDAGGSSVSVIGKVDFDTAD